MVRNLYNLEDTICACATPPGKGGIAVLRLSGPKSLAIGEAICTNLKSESIDSHRALLSKFLDPNGLVLDEGLVTFFKGPRSYTGEDSLEISCHGNPVIVRGILNTMVSHGARVAGPGEFTSRAFLNGKIDLVQAESVLTLIEANSEKGTRLAFDQLEGSLSKKLKSIKDDLIWILANLEASIDFTTEDIDVLDYREINLRATNVKSEIELLLESFSKGRLIKDGFRVAIVGRPNVGKSSLLNCLVGVERAIVSDVAGTTRDTVESRLMVDGVAIDFVDTAGLRNSEDQVEIAGIKRSWSESKKSDLNLFVFDLSEGLTAEDFKIRENLVGDVLVIGNKADLKSSNPNQINLDVEVSAKEDVGVDKILDIIRDKVSFRFSSDSPAVIQSRQFELLQTCLAKTVTALDQIRQSESPDLVSLELQEAVGSIMETLGEKYDDQVMDRVFKEFCIGK
jgi:tRNA modification GTPase